MKKKRTKKFNVESATVTNQIEYSRGTSKAEKLAATKSISTKKKSSRSSSN